MNALGERDVSTAMADDIPPEELDRLDDRVRAIEAMQRRGVERDSIVMALVAAIPRLTRALRDERRRAGEAAIRARDAAFSECDTVATRVGNAWAMGDRERGPYVAELAGLAAAEEITNEIRKRRDG